ncbi:MAG TPA: insulinase family protein [Thermoanaerobaculia bacterium]|nr:insulinase family protein [Thermoanaerobaculia bacterium]
MRPLRKIALGLAAALVAAAPLAAQVQSYKDIKTPALHPLKIEQPKRIQLANGMVIFLLEDHELPLIRGSARIRGGGRDVPADKVGLISILGESWRTGGTESKTGDQLDDLLEARAARLETSGSDDSTTVGFNLLKGDFDFVFPLFVDLLQHPAFRQEKIDLAKTRLNTTISRRNDDPAGIANREAIRLAYGAESVYARDDEYATVAAVTRDDVLAFHKRFVHPNNIILGMVGDFDAAAMEQKLRAAFESWPKGPQASRVAPSDIHPAKPGVYFIGKDDVTQSNIAIVGPGIVRNNPDWYAVAIMNEIFGGGFSSRLLNEIRSNRGLAYAVGGGISAPYDHPGVFRTAMGTKANTTIESVDALRGEINKLVEKPITAQEVADAKEAILNAFVFTFDSKQKLLNQQMLLEFYGYPSDYFQRYAANIEKVTPADVERVAKKYISPNQLAVLVVGKEKDFEKPLSSLGEVQKIDITIPEPGQKPGAKAAAPAASNAEGVALAKKVRDFVGGQAKIDAVKATRSTGTMSVKTPAGPMEMEFDNLMQYPDSHRNVMKTPMGEVTMIVTPDVAYMSGPMGTQDMPGSQTTAMRNDSRADLLTVLRNIDKPGYTFTVTGTEKVGDVNAQVLEIGTGASTMKWYIDPSSGKLLRKVSQGRQGEVITEYTEWKTFGGLNLPVTFTITAGGQPAGGGKINVIEVNPTVDPKVFEKPATK